MVGLKHVINIPQKFFFLFSSSKACKFDFEAGSHRWKRTGTVFNNQPTYGDNPTARRTAPANQQGDWWIGGYENRPSQAATPGAVQGDAPQGTLASPFFTIVGKRISFLIGGGCDIKKSSCWVDCWSPSKTAWQNCFQFLVCCGIFITSASNSAG